MSALLHWVPDDDEAGMPELSTKETPTVAVAMVPETPPNSGERMTELCVWNDFSLVIRLRSPFWLLEYGRSRNSSVRRARALLGLWTSSAVALPSNALMPATPVKSTAQYDQGKHDHGRRHPETKPRFWLPSISNPLPRSGCGRVPLSARSLLEASGRKLFV
jgi:hypothetical protein